jgi:hypothetical protein
MSDLLYHGTCNPEAIMESGVLRKAPYGYQCVSLSRCIEVAKYFASLDRDGEEEPLRGIFVFQRADLIRAGFKLIPFHDPIMGEYARDEQEEQVWDDIPLTTGLLLRLDTFPEHIDIPRPPLYSARQAASASDDMSHS